MTDINNGTKTGRGTRGGHGPRTWIVGAAAAAVLAGAVGGGALWWNERSRPSQATAADCALAQKIIDGAQDLPAEKTDVAKWLKDSQELRRENMEDGYLGAQISKYESWAADHATHTGRGPSAPELRKTADTANAHCEDAGRTLDLPPIGS
ncbi:hypothetical protein [Streptomyces sp. NPDC101181]|uniref:hypothetical protein n=1 Tax=Streptomyces sp. NPDC101181 TaxID=3366125 RepID=UPI00380A6E34